MRDVDALVIGSGAGGGPIAYTLARAGWRVCLLEKGPRHTREQFIHDEVAICRRDFFVDSLADDPHVLEFADGTRERTDLGWISRCVGGGTVHMAGYFYRLHPEDFRMATLYGHGGGLSLADWPFGYEVLEPYYARVEQVIGVSGDAGTNPFEPPRSTSYPLPAIDAHPLAKVVDAAAAKLGMHTFPCPRGIASRPYAGRAQCVYCDFCGSYGCEAGAKSSSLEALIPQAEATGRCEVVPNAMVREVTVGADGCADGCVYLDEEGDEQRVRARVVVVACSAVESARLLLLSKSARFPQGLGNSTGQVGRNLHFSMNTTGKAWFRYGSGKVADEVLRARAPFLQRSLQDFYSLPAGVSDIPKGGTIRMSFPHANPIATAMKLARATGALTWGGFLKERMREYWHDGRQIEFEAFADHLPSEGTSIDLDSEAKDRWGLPAARIRIAEVPHHEKAGAYLQARGMELLAACGADEVEAGVVAAVTGHLVHGTCRMGTDPATSVTDADGRAHDCPNLYVTDGAAIPHAGGVTSTLTILANAFRIADRILAAR